MSSSSSSQKTVFLVGPGFIGSTLLARLKEVRPDLKLYALTRRDESYANGIFEVVKGSLDDHDLIKGEQQICTTVRWWYH